MFGKELLYKLYIYVIKFVLVFVFLKAVSCKTIKKPLLSRHVYVCLFIRSIDHAVTIKSYNNVKGEFLYFKSNFEVIWNMLEKYFTAITSKICQDHKKMACLIMCTTLFLKYFQNFFFS